MLTPHDLDLVSRDARLPGLATVLDPRRLALRLEGCMPEVAEHIPQILYIRYRPEKSCLVAYRLAGLDDPRLFYANAVGADKRPKIKKARSYRAIALEPLKVVVLVTGDRALNGFVNLERQHRFRLFKRLLPGWDPHEVQIRTFRYKPERRYVGAVVADECASAVLRLYAAPAFKAARARAAAFRPRDGLHIPRLIGSTRRYGALAMEWVEGEPLLTALVRAPAPWTLATVTGRALAELHCEDGSALPIETVHSFINHLKAVAGDIGRLAPHLAERARRSAQRLAAELEDQPSIVRAVHGDFHADQVLVNSDQVAFLDFDRAARADAAVDLGMFLAHLERDHLRGTMDPGRADAIRHGLIDGYRARSEQVPTRRIQLYAASGLLRLVPHAFRDREPDWPGSMARMLERAEHIIESRNYARGS